MTWGQGSTQAVTWDPANTNIAPVNASEVAISLSVDGGHTYPNVLPDRQGTKRYSSRRLKNHVLRQRPRPGTRLANGGRVNLTVGRGPRR